MIEVPKFEEKDYLQFCLIKRYRIDKNGKKITKYSFRKIGLSKNISYDLRAWLLENIKSIQGKKLDSYNPATILEEPEFVNLSKIPHWNLFLEKGFSGFNFDDVDLRKEKGNLIGIMFYVKKEGKLWGQIKRIHKTSVLNQKGLYMLYLQKNNFNEIKEEKGIRFDKSFDILFYSDDKESSGIIFDKSNFKTILDLWEEDKIKSLENLDKVELFQRSEHLDTIKEITESDMMIQRMLRNPAFEEYLNDLTYPDLVALKEEMPELIFDLNPEKQDFIFPEENKKDAMKDLIKVLCGRYNYSLNKKNIVENSGVKKVYKK
jgi:hypothetical protein